METFDFILKMSVVAFVLVAILVAIPYMFVKLTEPTWAIPKTIIEFFIIASVLIMIFSQMQEPIARGNAIWGMMIALFISVFRYRSRVTRYRKIKTQSNAENI